MWLGCRGELLPCARASGACCSKSHPAVCTGYLSHDGVTIDLPQQAGHHISYRLEAQHLACFAANFKDHLTSKAHVASAKRQGMGDDELRQLENVVAASSVQAHVEDTETHMQRLERFQQVHICTGLLTASRVTLWRCRNNVARLI